MKNCIITGSNGYLGSLLVKKFKDLDWNVYEFSSSKKENQVEFKLSEVNLINEKYFENCNLLIHTSYDFSTNSNLKNNPNIDGSIKLFEKAHNMGVEKIINISTISSFKNSKSFYGKTKYEIEEKSKKFNVINLRPGLFYGSSSKIIRKIENICNTFPIIPMIGDGSFRLHLTNYDDLFKFILEIYEDKNLNFSKILYPCTHETISFKKLIKIISQNKKTFPVPLYLIFFTLKILGILKIKLPLDLDNLKGLIYYSDEINFDDTKKYKTKFRSL